MKNLKYLLPVCFVALFASGFGCHVDGLNSSPENAAEDEALSFSETVLNGEFSSAGEAGINVEDVDAIFSLGWHPFKSPRSEEEGIRSQAFAVAPNADATMQPRLRGGLDMGQVILNYAEGSAELRKIEKRRGGVFYRLGKMRPGPFGRFGADEEDVNVPFIAGGTYTFVVTGSEDFPAISLEVTAPSDPIQITSHSDDAEIDANSALDITWSGGVEDQLVVIALLPALQRPDFAGRGGFNGRGRGPGAGRGPNRGGSGFGPGGRSGGPGSGPGHEHDGPGFGGMHPHGARFIVESSTGAFSISAEELQNLLTNENVSGLILDVTQIQKSETEQDGAKYAALLRTSDVVKLQVAN